MAHRVQARRSDLVRKKLLDAFYFSTRVCRTPMAVKSDLKPGRLLVGSSFEGISLHYIILDNGADLQTQLFVPIYGSPRPMSSWVPTRFPMPLHENWSKFKPIA